MRRVLGVITVVLALLMGSTFSAAAQTSALVM